MKRKTVNQILIAAAGMALLVGCTTIGIPLMAEGEPTYPNAATRKICSRHLDYTVDDHLWTRVGAV